MSGAGLQETKGEVVRWGDHFCVVASSATAFTTATVKCGCEILISHQLRVDGGDIAVLASRDDLLIVRFKVGALPLLGVVSHAPSLVQSADVLSA